LLELIPDWATFLADQDADLVADQFHRHTLTGRPLGSDDFITRVEARLGRVLRPQKPGPKPGNRDTRTRDVLSRFGEK
jgi:putative transposase